MALTDACVSFVVMCHFFFLVLHCCCVWAIGLPSWESNVVPHMWCEESRVNEVWCLRSLTYFVWNGVFECIPCSIQ